MARTISSMNSLRCGQTNSIVSSCGNVTCYLTMEMDAQDETRLERFLASTPISSYMQTLYWTSMVGRSKFRHFRYLWCEVDGRIILGSAVRFTALFPGRYLASFMRGPLTRTIDDLDRCIPAVKAALDRAGVCTMLVNPAWQDGMATSASQILKNHGFRKTTGAMASSTGVVSLAPTEEEIFAGFQKRCRKDLRGAARKGLSVRAPQDESELIDFQMLFDEFAADKGIDTGGVPDMVEQWRYIRQNQGALLLAYMEGQLLGGAVVHRVGDIAFIVNVATRPVVANVPRAHSLVWEALRVMKRQGCKTADFVGMSDGGSSDDGARRRDMFKTAFNVRRVTLMPPHYLAIRPFSHALSYPVRQLFRKYRLYRFGAIPRTRLRGARAL